MEWHGVRTMSKAIQHNQKMGSVIGYHLRCPGCWTMESLVKDTFFSRTHLTLDKVLVLLPLLAAETGIPQMMDHVGISSATVVECFKYF